MYDIDLSLEPNLTGDISSYEGNEAINEAIKNIIFTYKTERFFNPYFGLGIEGKLFENNKERAKSDIKNKIENYLMYDEKGIDAVEVEFEDSPKTLIINIRYSRSDIADVGVFQYFMELIKS